MLPSPTDPQGSLQGALPTALTPGWSGDVDRGRCVVVSIVPPPQKLRTNTQSARPAQGLNTSNLQQREVPAGSTSLSVRREQREQEKDARRAPRGHSGENTIPFQWSSASSNAQVHPDTFYSYK